MLKFVNRSKAPNGENIVLPSVSKPKQFRTTLFEKCMFVVVNDLKMSQCSICILLGSIDINWQVSAALCKGKKKAFQLNSGFELSVMLSQNLKPLNALRP